MDKPIIRSRIEITPLEVGRRTIALVAPPEYVSESHAFVHTERVEFLCALEHTAVEAALWAEEQQWIS